MATTVGTFTFYNSYLDYDQDLLSTNTFAVQLHTSAYTPDAANHNFQDDLTNELPTANGYTVGGITLASKTWIRAGSTKTFDSDNPVWAAAGGSLTARRWVIVDTTPGTPSTNTLIGFGCDCAGHPPFNN